jgi:hypothetical protein
MHAYLCLGVVVLIFELVIVVHGGDGRDGTWTLSITRANISSDKIAESAPHAVGTSRGVPLGMVDENQKREVCK